MLKRLLAGAMALAAYVLLAAAPAPAAQSSSVEVFYPRYGDGRAYPFIEGGKGRNDFRLELVAGGEELKITDRSGKPIALRDFSERPAVCRGGGSATITCQRSRLVKPLITLRVALGRGDRFDIGKPGCRGNGGFESDLSFIDGATYFGGNGNDERLLARNRARVFGCGGSDDIDASKSRVSGGAGVDWISAKGGKIHGNGGDDQIEVSGNARAFGDGGTDYLKDGKGSSRLNGGPGKDGIYSGAGRDVLIGGPGRDIVEAGYRTKLISSTPPTYTQKPTQRDKLACGSGRDRAMAGRNSRVRGCERVTWLPRKIVSYSSSGD